MGVRDWARAAPWWLTFMVAGGLVFLFFGERVLVGAGIGRFVFTGIGGLVLIGAVAWRSRSWQHAAGDRKRWEGLLLLSYAGCVLAVVGFLVSSEGGMNLLGIEFQDADAERRYEVIVQVLSSVVVAISLLPALGAQWALAAHRHAGAAAFEVESLRAREIATGAVTVAFAGAFLLLAGYVASERDTTLDFSYFKTSSPGTGTQEVVRNLRSPVRALLFFPEVNAVKDEVQRYFRTLAAAAGNLDIEVHDRMIVPNLAREHGVTEDGTIVLIRDERSQRMTISPQIGAARARLRDFDRAVHGHLLQLARPIKVAYLTVGHGEINDPTEGVVGDLSHTNPLRRTQVLREILQLLNYRVVDLGLRQGLGSEIPADAGMVSVLGPQRPFLEEELNTLDRYAAGGGALLLALDPASEFTMGPLEDRLSVTFNKVLLADDRQYLRRRGNISDRQYIVTDRFSAHEAVTTLSRTRVGSGILVIGAGYLEEPETAGPDGNVRRNFVIRSLPSTFADLNGNFEFDAASEERRAYNLVAAIEGVVSPPKSTTSGASNAETGPRAMRALVYADAQMFSDAVLTPSALNAALAADGIRWLGGEESFGGEIESEQDVRIVHTNVEDVAWFYSTIVGAPLVVLAVGFVSGFRRRRKGTQAA